MVLVAEATALLNEVAWPTRLVGTFDALKEEPRKEEKEAPDVGFSTSDRCGSSRSCGTADAGSTASVVRKLRLPRTRFSAPSAMATIATLTGQKLPGYRARASGVYSPALIRSSGVCKADVGTQT